MWLARSRERGLKAAAPAHLERTELVDDQPVARGALSSERRQLRLARPRKHAPIEDKRPDRHAMLYCRSVSVGGRRWSARGSLPRGSAQPRLSIRSVLNRQWHKLQGSHLSGRQRSELAQPVLAQRA